MQIITSSEQAPPQHAAVGATEQHYLRLGLDPARIQLWEDGLRTDAGPGSFEWWYFHGHLEDGSTLTIEFHTKPPFASTKQPLSPFLSLSLDRPGGVSIKRALSAPAASFSAARERCDVRIGKNTFAGDLQRYAIHVELDDIAIDVSLSSEVPAWRPATGHLFFGQDEASYVAWLPAVPRGSVRAQLRSGGRTEQLRGSGYHDHNWGNTALPKLVDHWYWGHTQIEEYTFIALLFASRPAYGRRTGATCMLAKDNQILTEGIDDVPFTTEGLDIVPATRVPVANRVTYHFAHAGSRYAVSFTRQQDIFHIDLGKAGAYQRFLGEATLERSERGAIVETRRATALWELLYFGERAHPAE